MSGVTVLLRSRVGSPKEFGNGVEVPAGEIIVSGSSWINRRSRSVTVFVLYDQCCCQIFEVVVVVAGSPQHSAGGAHQQSRTEQLWRHFGAAKCSPVDVGAHGPSAGPLAPCWV